MTLYTPGHLADMSLPLPHGPNSTKFVETDTLESRRDRACKVAVVLVVNHMHTMYRRTNQIVSGVTIIAEESSFASHGYDE